MAHVRTLVALASVLSAVVAAQFVEANTCNASSPAQEWALTAEGFLTSATSGACLTAEGGTFPVADGTALLMMPCGQEGVDPRAQRFAWNSTYKMGIVLAADPSKCLNLAGYGTSPGTEVWLYGCVPPAYECEENCEWVNGTAGRVIVNPPSSLCLDDGGAAAMPRACAPGSPAAALPMCDRTLTFTARAADIVSRLSLQYKLSLLLLPLPVSLDALVNATLGLASFAWDVTLIHGISTTFFVQPLPNATSFPHSIAQAASFDVLLAQVIAAAVAYEARAVNARNFALTGGRSFQALLAEGGPLANTAFTPLYGRTMESYGECPFLVSTFAQAFVLALQNETAGGASGVTPGNPPFLQTAAVVRHFLGYHGANDLPNNGEEWVTPQFLVDQHLPAYEAAIVGGAAEGVMCSINTLRVGAGDGPAGGIPACVDPLLYGILYGGGANGSWASSAFVQSDNEAIQPMYTTHGYYKTLQEAVVGFVSAGGIGIDSGLGVQIVAALASAVSAGQVTLAQVDAYVARQFLTRLRLGEFDMGANGAYPFPPEGYTMDKVDGAEHRALAREAVTKSVALLRNAGGVLPLTAPPATVAVVGPWADSHDRTGGYFCNGGYLGNYATTTSVVSTVLDAARSAWPSPGSTVQYAPGTTPTSPLSNTSITDAATLAASSDVTLLVLGLGCSVETEGVDRPDLYLPAVQVQLLAAVGGAVRGRRAAGLPATLILVTVSAGLIDLEEALVDAWLQLFIPGEEAGNGLMDVVTGRVSPSARLPLTLYASSFLDYAGPTADFNLISQTTGVGRTYRYADTIPPGLVKHMFGFGLSYATFAYSALTATVEGSGEGGAVTAVVVNVTVSHAGGFTPAREVVQLYVSVPRVGGGVAVPLLALQAFTVVEVSAGGGAESAVSLTFRLPFPAAFAYTDVDGTRRAAGGVYTLSLSGHQPGDVEGLAVSNVVSANVTLPTSPPIPPPWESEEGGGRTQMERGALLQRVSARGGVQRAQLDSARARVCV